jgi:hypothetical protein
MAFSSANSCPETSDPVHHHVLYNELHSVGEIGRQTEPMLWEYLRPLVSYDEIRVQSGGIGLNEKQNNQKKKEARVQDAIPRGMNDLLMPATFLRCFQKIQFRNLVLGGHLLLGNRAIDFS